jgi:hypothetical protein
MSYKYISDTDYFRKCVKERLDNLEFELCKRDIEIQKTKSNFDPLIFNSLLKEEKKNRNRIKILRRYKVTERKF